MGFQSILSPGSEALVSTESREEPAFFHDLNLDQLVKALCEGEGRADLAPFYQARLTDPGTITYRQEVARDLENGTLLQILEQFSTQMYTMRQHHQAWAKLPDQYHKYERAIRFLRAAETYCEAVADLWQSISQVDPKSRGMTGLREYLSAYAESETFRRLTVETRRVASEISAINYCVVIGNGTITVQNCEGESDYTTIIEQTFEKFSRRATKEYLAKLPRWDTINHIQEQVLRRLALLHPEIFGALDGFAGAHGAFLDEKIVRFDREVRFFISYLEYIEPLRKAGLSFCYPEVTATNKNVGGRAAFDLPLAHKLVEEKRPVVCNDFSLKGSERIIVVSGPNQGGKTTFARMFGQLHYLASLGLPVPGSESRLFLFDRMFSHFEREEEIRSLRGKLKDDLFRIRQVFDQATPNSVIIMNEIFSSTSLKDSIYLGRKIMARISDLDLLAVCVTFVEELASYNEKTVSMVSRVDPANPAVRTYKVERVRADGLAYALAIAEKHRVTYESLKKRIAL